MQAKLSSYVTDHDSGHDSQAQLNVTCF